MKRGRKYHGRGKNIMWKKRKGGGQYYLPFKIKLGRGKEDGNFWEENQDFKKWGWETLYTSEFKEKKKRFLNRPVFFVCFYIPW